MSPREWLSLPFLLIGLFFLLTSAIALLRFPDTLCRLHALAKADNVALGFIVCGLLPLQSSLPDVGKLLLVWVFTLLSSATSGFGLARRLHERLPAAPEESP